MSLKSCAPGSWFVSGGLLWVLPSCRCYAVLPTPQAISASYQQIHAATTLQCRPRLIWTSSLGGSVGLYVGDAIVLGRDDLLKLANKVWRQYLEHRSDFELYLEGRASPIRRVSFEQAWEAVVQFVIAHELGHARQTQERFRGSALASEADADVFAGLLGTALGWDRALHRFVAHALGCNDPLQCEHPSSEQRVALRDSGEALYRRIA